MASLRATPQWATAVSQHEVTSLLYRPPSLRWVAWHPRPWHFLLLQRPTGSRLALFLVLWLLCCQYSARMVPCAHRAVVGAHGRSPADGEFCRWRKRLHTRCWGHAWPSAFVHVSFLPSHLLHVFSPTFQDGLLCSVAPDPSRHVGVDVGGDGILPMLSDTEDDAALLGSVDRDDVETVRGHSNDGMERGSLAVPDVPAVAPRSSISARIGDNYAGKLEAGRAVPCESSVHALLPSDFATPAFQAVLRHIVNAGGAGLAQGDQEKLGALLLMLEESYKLSQDQRQVARRIPKAQSLVTPPLVIAIGGFFVSSGRICWQD
ncbi:hypothetical protein I4F81_011401 [Pyropia yezoensis]|uniref:Uncharacterized protein n=1 Tax=Pyropia yezoensis TaxID=2788 RepID=A0ACC3CFH4_PYRYE|nr:hypothetical protein I4F81_011401 [Neopyropia yezoensis]